MAQVVAICFVLVALAPVALAELVALAEFVALAPVALVALAPVALAES